MNLTTTTTESLKRTRPLEDEEFPEVPQVRETVTLDALLANKKAKLANAGRDYTKRPASGLHKKAATASGQVLYFPFSLSKHRALQREFVSC